MNQGIKTIIYPVQDMARAKALYTKLLGVTPFVENPHYVSFNIGDQHIGLDPNFHKSGNVGYYHVGNINESLQLLLDAGAQVEQNVKEVGGSRLVASVRGQSHRSYPRSKSMRIQPRYGSWDCR